jgi:acyl carrier protein
VDDRDDHLMRCFASAFPSATHNEIRTAKTFDAIPGWDSLRMVNLLAVLDDEFGVQIELPEVLEQEPFDSVKQYLLQRGLTDKELNE